MAVKIKNSIKYFLNEEGMVSRRCTNTVLRLRNVLWKLVPAVKTMVSQRTSQIRRLGQSDTMSPSCHHNVITDSVRKQESEAENVCVMFIVEYLH